MQIVTIDFDIIMAPSIDFYNHMVPGIKWDSLNQMIIPQLFYGDYIHYFRLTEWLIANMKRLPKESIQFVYSHDKVYHLLDKSSHYDIINIDHHHDLGYPDNNNDSIVCANWVNAFIKENRLDSYTWINNENSQNPQEDINSFPYKSYLLKNYDLNNLKPSIIIICLSPEWVPPQIQPLFEIWIEIYKNHYDTLIEIK